MSDIIVKQLAELIGAPVDSLLQQLKDADIAVSGPDDSITDRQKLKLLEFIRTGQATTADAAPKTSGGKISLKRRSSTEVKGAQLRKSENRSQDWRSHSQPDDRTWSPKF